MMTSMAMFPPKRSITDMMDEELYQVPSSPIQVNTTSPKFSNRNMNTQLYSQGNGSNISMSNYLNMPEAFLDQYRGVVNNNIVNDTSYAAFFDDAMEVDREESRGGVNPFTDYGNPDSSWNIQYTNQPLYPVDEVSLIPDYYDSSIPLPQQYPTRPNRRRRITILDDDDSTKKEEDYMLYNPDIQPSHLVNNNNPNNLWDDFLVVPSNQVKEEAATTLDVSNTIIPGYENDYLLYEDFDEEVEEDLSEEEEDEENYYHVDDEFDELIMKQLSTQDNLNFMDMDNYLSPRDTYKQQEPPHEELVLELRNQMQDFQIQDERLVAPSSKEDDSYPAADYLEDNNSKDSISLSSSGETYEAMTAAEITAQNPEHHCDLVNPATGVPCNKQFSRPYDLVRHQETIHASKKKVFRCVICEGRLDGGPGNGKQKTFSRGDALSRHIKVKHGLGGKEALELINKAKENVEYVPVF